MACLLRIKVLAVCRNSPTGQPLYDEDGQTLTGPDYFLGDATYTSDTVFWDKQTSTDIFAAFSLPKHRENLRSYVSYESLAARTDPFMDSWGNYIHQKG